MTLDAAGKLAAAELAIYIILLAPIAYSLIKHGKKGILGWFYFAAFCTLRIIGSALQIHDEKSGASGTTAQIINGVGLSPLVLGFIGVLHEANFHLKHPKPFFARWPLSVVLHLAVGPALALVIVGYKSHADNAKDLTRVGYVIFVLIWAAIVVLTFLSWQPRRTDADSNRLLFAITIGLPFLGVRILYSCISSFDADINAFTGPIAYRVVLAVLMEFIIMICFAVFGVLTRNIGRKV